MPRAVILTFDERVDRRILREAESLQAAGFEVVGIASPRYGGEIDPDPPWLQRVDPAEAVTRARGGQLRALWARYGRSLAARYPFVRNVATTARRVLTRSRAYDPTSYFDALIYPAASRVVADVYIAHDLPLLATAVRCAQQHGAVSVYDSHELWAEQEFEAGVKAKWRALEAKWIGEADAVVAVNTSIADELKRRHKLSQVSVVHNAERPLPPARIKPRLLHQHFGLPPDARVVLFQGGYSATRNLDNLIGAFAQVQDSRLHLVMLGWGEMQGRLERMVRQRNLSARVHFHPKVAQDVLLSYTQSADLGIIPYRPVCLNTFFCTPNKLFEFIAAGLPIVASDLPELRRFVAGLDIGLVGDTGSAQGIAALIDQFFADPAQATRFTANMAAAQLRASWAVEEVVFMDAVRAALDRGARRAGNPLAAGVPTTTASQA
jgi:glycosyltransferase involved in cell wall biosynthesis